MQWLVVIWDGTNMLLCGTFEGEMCLDALASAIDEWEPKREFLEQADIIVTPADDAYES